MKAGPSIVVIAGEASGDAHAGRLITALRQQDPAVRVSGIGGDNMRRAGATIFADFSELAVMGLVEVLARYRHIRRIFSQLVARLEAERPDLLVLVDYPGFNLKLARKAKKLGIPVLSSNYCLAWALLDRLKLLSPPRDGLSLLSGYEHALERL